ncbi:TPA: hypothetical protein ACKP7M_000567 [Stenotrophomonas maltophilia]|nr:hypothetical protein [Stenotrophomonas maltophilia]HEL7760459.1 hypothetical protein [Stenotrophomonas maltophilia]
MSASSPADFTPNQDETAAQAAEVISLWASERNLTGAQVRLIFEAGMAVTYRLRPDVLPGELVGAREL